MKTKNRHPLSLISPDSPVLKVLGEFLQLKNLYRQGWLKRRVPEERCESVADHTLGTAILSMFMVENYYPGADLLKTLRMALIHEAGEVYAGDITPVDGIAPEEKHALEQDSAVRVFDGLPQAEEYLALWEEFEESETVEARIVRQADRLEMMLQTCYYEAVGYWNFTEFFDNTRSLMKDPPFRALFGEIERMRVPVSEPSGDKP
ncbi:MAG TPA: HD domain-containing protein [bacterium]|mgnify:CR=1 FL=1|nr:HD domain-containing protein [bacterium]HPJ71822.1 HD domain-containing protein [bacterium]HPQ66865.1 HD domain-containing protein [bacterium]